MALSVIGAGFALLQAIASPRRPGAIVQADYVCSAEMRPLMSAGPTFVRMEAETGRAVAARGDLDLPH